MKIAHITDIHLRQHIPGNVALAERQVRRMPELFPQALKQIQDCQPDILIITGDLLDAPLSWIDADKLGNLEEENREAALQDYRLLYEILEDQDLPYVVLAGNHDLQSAMWNVFPQKDTVHCDGFDFHLFHDDETENHMPQRLDDQLERFEATLETHDESPQIHVQHYVLTPSIHEGYPHSYKHDRTHTQKIDDSGRVILSLSGHFHPGTELIHLKNTYFTTGPAFCVAPFPYRIYEIDDKHVTMQQFDLGID
ncbi:metallophosphoesterase family protein [Poriferisphaera sp. WC338]|uniref:metallophosphoesterase family protein n=1 Tax=Poriferisphaera sp. WC338 TaxID=3425129 RepID=UPI003D819189